MQWDGTFLGFISKNQILEIVKYARETYWRLKITDGLIGGETSFICKARTAKSTDACIIDQLKQLFNIPKIGTHWVRMGKKIFIISKVDSDNIYDVVVYSKLAVFDKSIYPEFTEEVRTIFAFKEAFGVKFATLNAVGIVRSNIPRAEAKNPDFMGWNALSIKDTHFGYKDGILNGTIVKTAMLKLWFNKNIENVNTHIRQILNMTSGDIGEKKRLLKARINDIIKKVDKDQVSLANVIEIHIDGIF